ncbi:ATP-binding protein, partial [Acinetobacter seifertii]|uniref:AAA family ATPase n=1 Tax=Acinetobacter seifertii TaxID=1530123 RepID=UPI0015811680
DKSELIEELNKNFSLMSSFKFKKDKGKVFFKTESGKELSLHLASSAIKTNFALWVYLSQINKKSNLLMIDEPELNLHPDAQRLMARLIVYLVNNGIKVAVSTHSDYFVKEINSLIMLKNDFVEKQEILERYNYKNFDYLDIDNIVAYHFKDGVAEQMLVDQKSGIQADTFDDVSNTLNAAYNDIYWAINEEDILS